MDIERRVMGVLGDEGDPAGTSKQALHQTLAIDKRDNDVPMSWAHAFVYDQDVAIEYLRAFHGVAFNSKKESADRVTYQVFVDVEAPVFVIRRRTWKPSRNLDGPKGQFKAGRPEKRNEDAVPSRNSELKHG